MTNSDSPPRKRDPLMTGLSIVVAVSLLAAVLLLALGFPPKQSPAEATVPAILTPGAGGSGETITDPGNGGDQAVAPIAADDLRELALALAAVITALTGLFGIVFTQIWRRREESRTDKTHALALERERLELERERLQLERDRLELERQRDALLGKGPAPS